MSSEKRRLRRGAGSWGLIDGTGRPQDGFTSDGVVALLDAFACHQVHLTAQDVLDLVLHRDEVEEAPAGVLGKRDQHIYIAVVAEVFAQHRAEDRQLGDLPPAAVRLDLLVWEVQLHETLAAS